MKACILTIGDELLIGQTVDTNSAWMGKVLNDIGIQVEAGVTVSDTKEGIMEGLSFAKGYDLVLMTGGLGPTKDDITKKVLAEYFDTELVFHQPSYDRLAKLFEEIGIEPNESHIEQCKLPAAASVLENGQGTAPGMWLEKEEVVFISMPGVPYEMKNIMTHQVCPRLIELGRTSPIYHQTLLTIGKGESTIAKQIEDFENRLPSHIKLAYLPSLNQVKLRLTGVDKPLDVLKEEVDALIEKLEESLEDIVWGRNEDLIEVKIGELCKEKNFKVAVAESCTAGGITSLLSDVSGASRYLLGGVVAYDNQVKQEILNVPISTLKKHGAVSEETVIAMGKGVMRKLGSDVSIAISGILGPTGGTDDKPVGTIWIAIQSEKEKVTHKLQLGKDRLKNKRIAIVGTLNLLLKFLLEHDLA